MIRRTALLTLGLAAAASGAWAEVARVRSGEHPDFTRLVVEAQGLGDWRFGRTDDGYELSLGPEVTGFDLSQAFDKIPRDRVSGIWQDPDSGRLRLALSCPCHAIAFEFRSGIVVIDIKQGPPPEGMSFEAPIDPPAAQAPDPEPPPETETAARPEPASPRETTLPAYDWLAIQRDTPSEAAEIAPGPLAEAPGAASLEPLREALLEQISRGVAEGVVDIATPTELPEPGGNNRTESGGLRISVGELPGVKAATIRAPEKEMTAQGAICLTDRDLDIASWTLPGTAAEQLGLARSGLFAEFDAPVRPAVLRAARAHIAMGFGAEARQFLDFLKEPDDAETARLRTMSHLIDLEPVDPGAFVNQETCDTAAALWAGLGLALNQTGGAASDHALNKAAFARSFSALPVHLRRHLGPVLVQYLLSSGDEETARLLRDAAMRAPGEAGAEVELMDAEYHLATGKEAEAGALADAVISESGPALPEAAITRVEAAFRGDRSVPPDMPTDLAAYRLESKGTPLEAGLSRALILASAMTGDFETAFGELRSSPETAADLWGLAVDGAGDGLFLQEAIAAAKSPPQVDQAVALAVASRLQDLGFAAQALDWLGPVSADAGTEARLLAARASLRLRDAILALTVLEGLDDPAAEALRAEARLLMGDAAGAAESLDRAGDTAARDRAMTWTRDWPTVSETGPDPWKAAAALVAPPVAAEAAPGPIARGTALVEESAAARAAIEGLLTAIPSPPATQ